MRLSVGERLVEFDSAFTAVWVEAAGAMKLAAYHSTRVPAD